MALDVSLKVSELSRSLGFFKKGIETASAFGNIQGHLGGREILVVLGAVGFGWCAVR